VELKSVAALMGDLIHPAEIATNSKPLATPKPASALRLSPYSSNSTGQPLAANEADDFWQTLRARIEECDTLINSLCDLRGDDEDHRAALLSQRKKMAPQKLDSGIFYLKNEIHRITKETP
jgi:hypothetical protein